MEFENVFQESQHKKVTTGIQQLYLIGLYDPLPVEKLISIFKKYLPPPLFHKLNRYVTSEPNKIYSTIHWPSFKSKLDQINTTECCKELITLLHLHIPSEEYVKTFHIFKNHLPSKSTEPNQTNTTQMISKFLSSIYQRNILASLIKYILLQPLLKNFQTSLLLSQKR